MINYINLKKYLVFIFGFIVGVLSIVITSSVYGYFIEKIDPSGKTIVTQYQSQIENDRFATSTFNSIADKEQAYINYEYQQKMLNKLDLILKELHKLNKKL